MWVNLCPGTLNHDDVKTIRLRWSVIMGLWKDLLFSDFGILSLVTILVAAGVVGFCVYTFIKKAREDERNAAQQSGKTPGASGAH